MSDKVETRERDFEIQELPEDDHINWDQPPPYDAVLHGSSGNISATITDDGRLDVCVKTKTASSDLLPPILPDNSTPYAIVGSRGDVQPFIALGQELKASGHRIRIATHKNFKDFVKSSKTRILPYRRRSRWSYGRIPFVADAIIANPPSFAHIHCAQLLSMPLHLMFTIPWSPTRAFPHPLANIQNGDADPRTANYLSYVLVDMMTWQDLSDVINLWRKKALNLEAVSAMAALIPKPVNWPSYIVNLSGPVL
ncbi:hypothetical protein BTUL_0091g00540 [Botrytis tulipae]|uniref:Glycosyltransferase family 28 N-terminal domain-containing protein n=1 Tax=Botrytis tulipae TaxID=87230 RepID=A0A4Z1EM82_9HELO|nr:hypothetical protein BTUL_0091g00540 [Botrytis tulipae]